MPAARLRLQQLLTTTLQGAALEVQEFTTLNPFYGQTIGLFASIFGFIAVLIGVIVLFTVGNTMSTAVLERTAVVEPAPGEPKVLVNRRRLMVNPSHLRVRHLASKEAARRGREAARQLRMQEHSSAA